MSVNHNRQFVESFHGGDALSAIREIAAAHGIAVAVQDRADFEETLGREMTEEEFEDLKPCLDGYGEFLGNSGAAESIVEWRHQTLEKYGFFDEEEAEDDDIEDEQV